MYKKSLSSQTIMRKSNIFAFILLLLLQVLLVFSQSTDNTPIDDRPCIVDSDCINSNVNPIKFERSFNNQLRLGNFMCVQKKCKFVVAAGQQCGDASDCAAYHYSNLYNISLGSDICGQQHCNLQSKCDGAWDQNFSIRKIGDPSTCCIGLNDGMECNIVANDVDPCKSKCHLDEATNNSKCVNDDKDFKKHIWIGVLVCLLGSTTLNVGLNIQKYAFTKHQEELDKQQQLDILDDDNSSIKNSNGSIANSIEHSNLYKKLERFMFWKQIIVSPIWVIGLGIYIIGSLLTFVALKFAPQSLVAPLGAVSLVVNLLIAPILHHQKLTTWDIIGVLIIIGGSVVITVFSGIVIQDYKLCVLIELFRRPQTIAYLSVIALFIFSLYTFIRVVERNSAQKDNEALAMAIAAEQEESKDILYPTINTTDVDISEDKSIQDHENKDNSDNQENYTIIALDENKKSLTVDVDKNLEVSSFTTVVDQDAKSKLSEKTAVDTLSEDEIEPTPVPRISMSSVRTTKSVVRQHDLKEKVLLPLAYAILASSMATITTLFAKSLINLLTVSFTQENQFKDLLSWTILIITISTAIGQVYWISMGLKKYDALLQVPIFYCNWSLFDIIGGGVYYDEFRHFGTKEYTGFVIGISLIFFGVSLLSKRLAKLTKEEEDLKERKKEWEQQMKNKKKNKRS